MKKIRRRLFIKIFSVIFLFNIVFLPISNVLASPITIKVEADCHVESSDTNANYGGDDYIKISNNDYNTEIGFIRFNLNNIKDLSIISATLKMYTSYVSETHLIGIYLCSSNTWNELIIDYDSRPSCNPLVLATKLVASDSEWCDWDVKEAINNSLSTGIISFAIVSEDQHTSLLGVWFYSKEIKLLSDYAPKLVVSYKTDSEILSDDFLGIVFFAAIVIALSIYLIFIFLPKRREKIKPPE